MFLFGADLFPPTMHRSQKKPVCRSKRFAKHKEYYNPITIFQIGLFWLWTARLPEKRSGCVDNRTKKRDRQTEINGSRNKKRKDYQKNGWRAWKAKRKPRPVSPVSHSPSFYFVWKEKRNLKEYLMLILFCFCSIHTTQNSFQTDGLMSFFLFWHWCSAKKETFLSDNSETRSKLCVGISHTHHQPILPASVHCSRHYSLHNHACIRFIL